MYSTTDEISDMRRRSSYEYERSGSPARDTTSMTYGSALGGHRMGAGGGAGHGGEEYAGKCTVAYSYISGKVLHF